mgnify:FL=1
MKRNGTALIGRIFKITFQSTGIYAVLAPLYYLIEGLFPAVETMVYAMLFDGAAAWITGGHTGENGKQLWIMAGILVVLSLFRGGLNVIGSIAINIGIYERLPAFLNQKLAEKCARLSMIDFENSEIYDQCLRARECLKREQISALYMILAVLFSCILSAASSGAVLASYSPVIIPLAFLSVIPYFVGFRLLGQKFYRMQKSQTPARREAEYFWKTLTKPESVRELRMAGAVEYMEEKWMVQNRKMQRELYDYRKREACCILLCDVIQVAGIGASIGLTLYLAVKGQISIGEFGACISAYSRLQAKAEEFFTESGRLQEKISFASDYFSFMELKEEEWGKEQMERFPEEIVLKDLSFRYPNAERMAVEGVNLTIRKGESIAIVGENGSGKTTLTRLIAGLYEPSEGQICFKNQNLQEIKREDSGKWISAIDQRFIRYLLTLRENVAISHVQDMENDLRILQCLKEAGMENKAEELDQAVGNLNGGREFSQGQWQRIAIARALFRPAELFLMDEPTSALDPVLEAEILQQFLQVLKEKTCVIVSHRIGLCRYVDRIVVMKDGKAAEVGSHEELYSRKGEYWRIFNSQSRWYHTEERGTGK